MEYSMTEAVRVADEVAREYARRFGRYHPLIEEYRTEDADLLFVTSGTIAGTARAVIDERRDRGEKVGLVKIRLFRPFPFAEIRRTLGRAKKLAVVDRNLSFGHGGIMASEARAALCNQPSPPVVFSYIAGLGGRDVTPEVIDAIVQSTMAADRPEADSLWVGLKE
jgi:pyruvate ferredoxin oxidoreductase alpha subunit